MVFLDISRPLPNHFTVIICYPMAYHGLSTSPSSKASFGSYRSQGTATDLLADVSMTQARQTGQDVLSAVTATVPEPFGPQLSTAKARKIRDPPKVWVNCPGQDIHVIIILCIYKILLCVYLDTHTYVTYVYIYICDYMCSYAYNV